MKKKIFIFILTLFMFPRLTYALGASGSVAATVEKGDSVTFKVNVKDAAAWNISITGSGATSGCSKKYVGDTGTGKNKSNTFSITCKAKEIGTITFKATGDITDSSRTNKDISITKTVNVVKPREKESEARLSNLTIDGYNINFDKDNYTYNIEVEPTVTSIKVKATPISKYAKVSGVGTKTINGDTKFNIVSTSETGIKKTYVINVSIKDSNPININVDNNEYTILKNVNNIKEPINSTKTVVKINNFDIPAFKTEKTNLTIIGIKDKNNNYMYATYDNGKYEIYNENKSSELNLYIKEKELDGYDKDKVKINDIEYPCYKINDKLVIIYALNLDTNEYNYYSYDKLNNTYQLYDIDKKEINNIEKDKNNNNNNNIFIVTTIIFGILFIISLVFNIIKIKNKNNKKED